ncbi:MAG TPA: hypothetical protein ENI88_08440 [Desulfobulbus sp.]|nr:hypothetical protein [Desulfobulbus sp.]
MRFLFVILPVLLSSFLLSALPAPAGDRNPALHDALVQLLENQPTSTLDMITTGIDPATIDRALLSLYIKNDNQPLWISDNRPGSRAQVLLQTLEESALDGLNPDDYQVAELLTLWDRDDSASRARLDVLLTLVLGRYVADMREGSADPCLLDPKLFAAARDHEVDILQVVNDALQADNLALFLANQAPSHAAYRGLRKALAAYRHLQQNGGWKTIPAGPTIKPGMSDPRIPLVAERLLRTGELTRQTKKSQRYDQELTAAIKKFQNHFLLEPDGIIGKKTLAALNIPLSRLIQRIILNMERWRWLPHRLNGKRIFVNIAGFQLFGATDEQIEITMPVIVGKVYHKTPVFTGSLRYIEINPFWNIPDSIAVNEMVPHMQKDPDYLSKKNIRIFKGWQDNAPEISPAAIDWQTIGKGIKRYRLRQDPGPENALGRIKFMFPNTNNIYLHDTPAHELFLKTKRDFSHGCIRVSRPLDLGEYLLKGNKKPLRAEQLKQLIDSNKRKIILLDKQLPVHILYRTVRASAATGEVFFYPDLYKRDVLLARALFARKPLSQCRYVQ